jgi:[acyl-carrier-protein] S-malonyltransferase
VVKAAILCPGQGAQQVGMGKDLDAAFPEAHDVFAAADDALGTALSTIMWDGPADELTLTHNAQPAILVHSLAVHAIIQNLLDPAVAAGHSLGEYSAYAMAGALTLADAVRLVRRRGELMLAAGNARPGTMAAVLGLEADVVEAQCRAASVDGTIAVAANLNAPDQIVISGDPDAVERASGFLKEAGARRVLGLNVSGAFHSPLMEPAREGLAAELDAVAVSDPRFPIVANATASLVRTAAEARDGLARQLTAPVRWVASMQVVADLIDADTPFIEIGPGNVLSGLVRRTVPGRTTTALGTAEQVSNFLEQNA